MARCPLGGRLLAAAGRQVTSLHVQRSSACRAPAQSQRNKPVGVLLTAGRPESGSGRRPGRAHRLPCAVAAEHLAATPSDQPHQIGLVATVPQPGVGEGVAEQVGVDAFETSLLGPAFDEGPDTRSAHRSSHPEPQRIARGRVGVPSPQMR